MKILIDTPLKTWPTNVYPKPETLNDTLTLWLAYSTARKTLWRRYSTPFNLRSMHNALSISAHAHDRGNIRFSPYIPSAHDAVKHAAKNADR